MGLEYGQAIGVEIECVVVKDSIRIGVNGRSGRSGRAKAIDSMGSALDFTNCITPDGGM